MKLSIQNDPETKLPSISTIHTDSWYQCQIREVLPVEPFAGDSRSKYICIAICVLMHNTKHDDYACHALTAYIAPETIDKRLYDVLRSIKGEMIDFSRLKNFNIDTDDLIGKMFSVKFRDLNGKTSLLTQGYIKPEKRVTMDITQYCRPEWINRKMIVEEHSDEEGIVALGDLQSVQTPADITPVSIPTTVADTEVADAYIEADDVDIDLSDIVVEDDE